MHGRRVGESAVSVVVIPCSVLGVALAGVIGGAVGAAHGVITEGPLGIFDGAIEGAQKAVAVESAAMSGIARVAYQAGAPTALVGGAIGWALGARS